MRGAVADDMLAAVDQTRASATTAALARAAGTTGGKAGGSKDQSTSAGALAAARKDMLARAPSLLAERNPAQAVMQALKATKLGRAGEIALLKSLAAEQGSQARTNDLRKRSTRAEHLLTALEGHARASPVRDREPTNLAMAAPGGRGGGFVARMRESILGPDEAEMRRRLQAHYARRDKIAAEVEARRPKRTPAEVAAAVWSKSWAGEQAAELASRRGPPPANTWAGEQAAELARRRGGPGRPPTLSRVWAHEPNTIGSAPDVLAAIGQAKAAARDDVHREKQLAHQRMNDRIRASDTRAHARRFDPVPGAEAARMAEVVSRIADALGTARPGATGGPRVRPSEVRPAEVDQPRVPPPQFRPHVGRSLADIAAPRSAPADRPTMDRPDRAAAVRSTIERPERASSGTRTADGGAALQAAAVALSGAAKALQAAAAALSRAAGTAGGKAGGSKDGGGKGGGKGGGSKDTAAVTDARRAMIEGAPGLLAARNPRARVEQLLKDSKIGPEAEKALVARMARDAGLTSPIAIRRQFGRATAIVDALKALDKKKTGLDMAADGMSRPAGQRVTGGLDQPDARSRRRFMHDYAMGEMRDATSRGHERVLVMDRNKNIMGRAEGHATGVSVPEAPFDRGQPRRVVHNHPRDFPMSPGDLGFPGGDLAARHRAALHAVTASGDLFSARLMPRGRAAARDEDLKKVAEVASDKLLKAVERHGLLQAKFRAARLGSTDASTKAAQLLLGEFMGSAEGGRRLATHRKLAPDSELSHINRMLKQAGFDKRAKSQLFESTRRAVGGLLMPDHEVDGLLGQRSRAPSGTRLGMAVPPRKPQPVAPSLDMAAPVPPPSSAGTPLATHARQRTAPQGAASILAARAAAAAAAGVGAGGAGGGAGAASDGLGGVPFFARSTTGLGLRQIGAFAGIGSAAMAARKTVQTLAETQAAEIAAMVVTQGNTGERRALKAKVDEVARDSPFSLKDAWGAVKVFSQAGIKPLQQQTLLPVANATALAGDMQLPQAAKVIANIATALGTASSELPQMADRLIAVANETNTDVMQLSQAGKYSLGASRTVGMPADQTLAALGLAANAGMTGTLGGTGYRTMMAKIAGGFSKGDEAFMAKNGISFKDKNGNPLKDMEQILDQAKKLLTISPAEFMKIFDQRAGMFLGSLAQQSIDDPTAFRKIMQAQADSSGEGMRVAAARFDGLKGGWLEFTSKLDGLVNSFGEQSGLTKSMETATRALGDLTAGAQGMLDRNAQRVELDAIEREKRSLDREMEEAKASGSQPWMDRVTQKYGALHARRKELEAKTLGARATEENDEAAAIRRRTDLDPMTKETLAQAAIARAAEIRNREFVAREEASAALGVSGDPRVVARQVRDHLKIPKSEQILEETARRAEPHLIPDRDGRLGSKPKTLAERLAEATGPLSNRLTREALDVAGFKVYDSEPFDVTGTGSSRKRVARPFGSLADEKLKMTAFEKYYNQQVQSGDAPRVDLSTPEGRKAALEWANRKNTGPTPSELQAAMVKKAQEEMDRAKVPALPPGQAPAALTNDALNDRLFGRDAASIEAKEVAKRLQTEIDAANKLMAGDPIAHTVDPANTRQRQREVEARESVDAEQRKARVEYLANQRVQESIELGEILDEAEKMMRGDPIANTGAELAKPKTWVEKFKELFGIGRAEGAPAPVEATRPNLSGNQSIDRYGDGRDGRDVGRDVGRDPWDFRNDQYGLYRPPGMDPDRWPRSDEFPLAKERYPFLKGKSEDEWLRERDPRLHFGPYPYKSVPDGNMPIPDSMPGKMPWDFKWPFGDFPRREDEYDGISEFDRESRRAQSLSSMPESIDSTGAATGAAEEASGLAAAIAVARAAMEEAASAITEGAATLGSSMMEAAAAIPAGGQAIVGALQEVAGAISSAAASIGAAGAAAGSGSGSSGQGGTLTANPGVTSPTSGSSPVAI